jgi:VCBS repeat-containing protein
MAVTRVFIDSRVNDKELLISQFAPGTEYQVLDANRDGIEQIVTALSGQSGYDSIQIISHGASGYITIGSTVLNSSTLDFYAAELALLGNALTENGDLLLYGCNVAAGDQGQDFIDTLSQLTGADVAASDDPTGGIAAGGDWVLEVQTGAVEQAITVDALNYDYLLANSIPTVSSPLAISVAEGDSSVSLNLLVNAHDADLTDTLSVGTVSYTVNGVLSVLPAGITMSGNTLTIDPANSAYDAIAQGQHKTIVATYQVLDNSAAAEISFATKVDYATGLSPSSVTSADVNGDGKFDLIVANHGSNTVSVLKNSGDGTFATKVDYATGSEPSSVTSTDVNGDGKFDLIIANNWSDTVSVLINSGNGTFATKVDYATGFSPVSISSADVNGDGKSDLIVADYESNTISVLNNRGDGTFSTKVDYATGLSPKSVTSADVNGDGKFDLIVANFLGNTVSVLKNRGDGTFFTKVDYATGLNPSSVTSADVNGDGNSDLIVANQNDNRVSVLINSGDGTFAKIRTYWTGSLSWPVSVMSADVNSDGKFDLIVANTYSHVVSVLKNNGDGTFATKVDYATGIAPISVTSADVNSDGQSDLIVANYGGNVSVLINNSTGYSVYPTTTATITINGTNDAPVVEPAALPILPPPIGEGAVTELVNPIGNLIDSGTIRFTDVDFTDSHTVSAVTASAGALGTLTSTITTDTTGTGLGGVVTWNYSVDAAAVEYLAAGEHKVESFTFAVLDGHGGSTERTVDVVITGTIDGGLFDLAGAVTFWKSGAAIAGVTSTLDSAPAATGSQLIEFRNIQVAADGTRTVEIWETSSKTDIGSVQLELTLPDGSVASWVDAAGLPSGWSTVVNTGISGQFLLAGMGMTALSAGPVKLGTLTLTAPTNPQHFDLSLTAGELGTDTVPAFSNVSDSMTTGIDGLYQHLGMADGTYALTSAKVSGTAEGNAIKANDALAALKIAVGVNPNADGSAVSPYQYLAADVNHDGSVKAADALNILKMAVKLDTAPAKEWLFVPDSVGSESMTRSHVVWPDNPLPITLDIDQELHLIGIVKGDVNGSWAA